MKKIFSIYFRKHMEKINLWYRCHIKIVYVQFLETLIFFLISNSQFFSKIKNCRYLISSIRLEDPKRILCAKNEPITTLTFLINIDFHWTKTSKLFSNIFLIFWRTKRFENMKFYSHLGYFNRMLHAKYKESLHSHF